MIWTELKAYYGKTGSVQYWYKELWSQVQLE